MGRLIKISDEAYNYLKNFKRVSKQSMRAIVDMRILPDFSPPHPRKRRGKS